MLTEQQKGCMQRVIQENQHDVFVISPDMMDEIVAIQAQRGNSQAQTIWEQIRGTVEFGANYFALTGDITKLAQLGYALGGLGQAYVKSYNGKSYIILKGQAGLRRILTGTRYLVNNTKVMALGLGKHAAQAAARSGGILTLYLVGAYRVTDFFLRDEATLTQLIGHLAVDVVKVAITVGAAYLASAAVAAAVGIAVGPIAAVVLVGIVLTPALNSLDEYFGISEKVVQGLEELSLQSQSYLQQIRRNVREKATQTASRAAKPVLDYIVDSVRRTAIDAAKHRLERFINPRFY
ncbi:hypothetical protein QWY20_12835 [Alkalimonas sp. MEB108]|uniref:Uncharacterized protein n=1 Tax=Alkalimonas cellulosilytica TaxID=3058395 RepID=A0ABU7J737_9GAMM|nr:hypothetical protein [Alkalimonas sp. MEB108]MEE2002341.1 hypothetical protein [Alkalimonas sp. MEB108]